MRTKRRTVTAIATLGLSLALTCVGVSAAQDGEDRQGADGRDGSSSVTRGGAGAPGPSGAPGQIITPAPPPTEPAPAARPAPETPTPTPSPTPRPTQWSVDFEPQGGRSSGTSLPVAGLAGAGLLVSAGLVLWAWRRPQGSRPSA